MREQLEDRLAELESEFEAGQARLRELDMERAQLTETMLRISGAIQVLRESLNGDVPAKAPETVSEET